VLYRRWPNKDELVLAAIEHRRNSRPLDIPDTGALRGDLIATLTRMVDIRANFFAVAAATAFSGLLASTGLTMAQLRERIIGDTESLHVLTIYRRAHDRGQIDLDHIPASVLTMPFDLVRHDMLMDFSPPTPTRIQSIVDELFLPLVSTAMEHTLSLGRPDGGRLCKRP
jgi:AcrR family transcriptional regulator